MTDTKRALVSGASFAGLSTAFWLRRLGYAVTIVETAKALRTGGTAVNIEGRTLEIAERMGILASIRADRLCLERLEYKNADDVTEGTLVLRQPGEPPSETELEVERNTLLALLFGLLEGDEAVEFVFDDGLVELRESADGEAIDARFRRGPPRTFDLVIGCDGVHSAVRRLWFGEEARYVRFLEQYFAIAIVDGSLVAPNTLQMFNVPGKGVMLNAYKDKTDIVLCFVAEKEIAYDYRDEAQTRRIVADQFVGVGWRTPELLAAVAQAPSLYFDKLCQVRMPAWSRGRVVLVGDAAYAASPAAGKGGSLALDGAAALGEALAKYPDDLGRAFGAYEESFRPFIEQVQADAVQFGLEGLCPRTEEAIRQRNTLQIRAFEGNAEASPTA